MKRVCVEGESATPHQARETVWVCWPPTLPPEPRHLTEPYREKQNPNSVRISYFLAPHPLTKQHHFLDDNIRKLCVRN